MNETGKHYVLIGTGYGAYKSARSSLFGGDLFPTEEEGEIPTAAVSDQSGNIHWFLTEKLRVVEIDGVKPNNILVNYTDLDLRSDSVDVPAGDMERCPACNHLVAADVTVCPNAYYS